VRTIWVLLLAALALCAMLLTACGTSGDDRAKVEASLRQYLTNLHPQACLGPRLCGQGVFPIGAGFPQVRGNSCKKTHIGAGGRLGWTCVVTFAHGKVAQPVAVAVKGSDEVYEAVPVSRQKLTPARVYQGGP
jgi:hypothetical protein